MYTRSVVRNILTEVQGNVDAAIEALVANIYIHIYIHLYIHMYIYIYTHTFKHTLVHTQRCRKHTGTYRMAKIHRMPYLCKSFSAKEPCDQGLFCGKRFAT